MKRLAVVTAALLGLAASVPAAPAAADTIHVGDLVQFNNPPGSTGTLGGGAFTLADSTTGDLFLTFCVQTSQHISYNTTYRVGGITTFADDVAGNDPIGDNTAWIYSSFRRGLLGAYTGNEIQSAIWYFEQESNNDYDSNAVALRALANAAVANGYTNDGVRVLNLFTLDGGLAQDNLTYTPTPEPTSLVLLATGLLGWEAARRLRARRAR